MFENPTERSIVTAAIETFYKMVATRGQGIDLVKAAGSGAIGWTLLAMKFLEMQIELLRVLRVGGEIVSGTWRFCAHREDGSSDLLRKMIDMIRIPGRVFQVLGKSNGWRAATYCNADRGSLNSS